MLCLSSQLSHSLLRAELKILYLYVYCRVRCPDLDCNTFNLCLYQAWKGLYTAANIDSPLDDAQVPKLSDKLTNCEGEKYTGELVAAVCHRPGHYVTYTKTDDGVWYLSDDSKKIRQDVHPYHSRVRGERVTTVFFKNF